MNEKKVRAAGASNEGESNKESPYCQLYEKENLQPISR
jgi:hypothetical protein